MLIVLDTNVIVENWLFDKSYHRAFVDYVNTVNCEVVFPQIVWSETRALYMSFLKDALNKQASANRNVDKFLYNAVNIQSFIDVEESYEEYTRFLMGKLHCGEHSITGYPKNVLPILAEKAIARYKPFSNTGEEFRDAILWHSVLEIAQDFEELNPVVFISKNTKEFADPDDKRMLHPELQYEVSKLKDRTILYYPSLEEFIKAHQAPIEHLTTEWVLANIPKVEINEIFIKYVNNKVEKIMPYFESKYNDIIFDTDWRRVQFRLRQPGLVLFSLLEAPPMYVYINGDISLFAEFEGIIYFGTSYIPKVQDEAVLRNPNYNHYSTDFIELEYEFSTQIEFNVKGKSLEFRGIINDIYRSSNHYMRKGRKDSETKNIDYDDFLPF